MLFNSLSFAIFLPIVFYLYWYVANRNLQFQNLLILLSSFFFYACWDWRFLFLLLFSILLDYITGIKIAGSDTIASKKKWLWISITINVGFLGVFKYYNFFAGTLTTSLSKLNITINPWTLKVILPVGISFYTFHGLSYVIDVFKDKIKPERNFVDYACFVSFFPLLVAGPIERATHLLPQIKKKRVFNYKESVDGLKQILWGLFKKIVIADNCAEFANLIFDNSSHYSGSTLLLGAIFFAIQIYGDFSGYSDIALGTARLFGFDLLKNFAYPYFSRDIAEFWRRWHISLSSWFKDYLYIPLGGSKGGIWIKIRNTLIIFLVSGFWHGANWTFIVWGLLNAIYIMPSIIFNTHRNNLEIVAKDKSLPNYKELGSIVITFFLTVFAWIFFRSESVSSALHFIQSIFTHKLFSIPNFRGMFKALTILFLCILFFIIEWKGREDNFAIKNFAIKTKSYYRWGFYYILMFALLYFAGKDQIFIYFNF